MNNVRDAFKIEGLNSKKKTFQLDADIYQK